MHHVAAYNSGPGAIPKASQCSLCTDDFVKKTKNKQLTDLLKAADDADITLLQNQKHKRFTLKTLSFLQAQTRYQKKGKQTIYDLTRPTQLVQQARLYKLG